MFRRSVIIRYWWLCVAVYASILTFHHLITVSDDSWTTVKTRDTYNLTEEQKQSIHNTSVITVSDLQNDTEYYYVYYEDNETALGLQASTERGRLDRHIILTDEQENVTLSQLQSMNLTSLITQRAYDITYPAFTYTEPYFASTEDYEMFVEMNDNVRELGVVPPEKLMGTVHALNNSFYNERYKCDWTSDLVVFTQRIQKSPVVSLNYICPLVINGATTLQYFVDGVLLKLMQVYNVIVKERVYLVITKPSVGIIFEILQALGINRNLILTSRAGYYFAKWQINTCLTPPSHPVLYRRARRILGVTSNHTHTNASVVLLLNDADSDCGMSNLQEVISKLRSRYSSRLRVVHRLESLQEARQMMADAAIVIGVHSESFYNVLFAPASTSVLEVIPVDRTNRQSQIRTQDTSIWKLSQNLRLHYYRMYAVTKLPNNNIELPLGKLNKLLDLVEYHATKQTTGNI